MFQKQKVRPKRKYRDWVNGIVLIFPAQAVINAHSGEFTVTGCSPPVENVSLKASCAVVLE